jgi:BirA family biotin operon repressor/biotin-[acetyl-CoA-carboxylase] ligase
MTPQTPIERWPDVLEAAIAAAGPPLARLVLLRETASTQDHARDSGATPGTVVVAWRQTAGRGRLGRAWADTGTEGVAATFVLPDMPPEALAMRSAVAAAAAVRAFVPGDAAGIKWPNDVVADGRKLAGVLVERTGGAALVGIGINALQRAFPPPLDATAASIAMLAGPPDRLAVVAELVRSVAAAMAMDGPSVTGTYRSLDRLAGRPCAFLTPGGRVEGIVEEVDPAEGIRVRTPAGPQFLPAQTTSVVPPEGGTRYFPRNAPDGPG